MCTDRWDDMFSNISALLTMLIDSDVLIIHLVAFYSFARIVQT